jgi:DNA-binding response OmpR family regulator
MDDYLSKPFAPAELNAKLLKALGNRKEDL